ncbi:hypothetical protein Droror1_Dr00004070 [Drosera rotundifolia]
MRCPFLFATIYAMIVQFKYFVCGRYFIRQQMVNTPYLPRENANVFYMKFFSTNYANIQNFNNIHKIIYTIFFFEHTFSSQSSLSFLLVNLLCFPRMQATVTVFTSTTAPLPLLRPPSPSPPPPPPSLPTPIISPHHSPIKLLRSPNPPILELIFDYYLTDPTAEH